MSVEWKAVRRFARNVAGRDFGLSDIHGAYELVIHAMKAAKFDPRVERLFVNGDMVDRGVESLRAKRFLEQSYVHAALGNHEFGALLRLRSLLGPGGPSNWSPKTF